MTPCRKCNSAAWCAQHRACGRSVRARWWRARRAGFPDAVTNVQAKANERRRKGEE